MSPIEVYQFSGRATLFLFGCFVGWVAIFFVLCELLHYEGDPHVPVPVRWTWRERIGWPLVFGAVGVGCIVWSIRAPSELFTGSRLAWFGCVSPLMALCFAIGLWQMGKERRRAVRLWAFRRALRLRRQRRATGPPPTTA